MKNYTFTDNNLKLRSPNSPIWVRIILYLITSVTGFLVVFKLINIIKLGDEIKIFDLAYIGIFGLIFFLILRIALWNTFGSESITIKDNEIEYYADYGWFKDNKKSFELKNTTFELLNVGNEKDNKAVLMIHNGEDKIQTVSEQPLSDLENIIEEIKNWCQSQ